MDKTWSLIVYALLIQFHSINIVSGIDCYICESNSNIECSEKFDPANSKLKAESCEDVHEARYCIKTTGIFEGQIGTKRMCSSRNYGDYCEYVKRPGDERDQRSCVFTCSSDACNHSESQSQLSLNHLCLLLSCFFIHILNGN